MGCVCFCSPRRDYVDTECPMVTKKKRLELQMRQVVPGRAGGGSFKRKKNHIAEKELQYRVVLRSTE